MYFSFRSCMDTAKWYTYGDNGEMRQITASWLWTLFVPISESLHNKPVSIQFYLSSRISRSRVSVRQSRYVIKINNGLLSAYPAFKKPSSFS